MAFILLLIMASLVAMVARKWQFPYTVALVATGMAMSLLSDRLMPVSFDIGLHLSPDLLFLVLLPVLVYEAAFHFDLHDFKGSWKSIVTLAAPGLIVGLFIAGSMFYGIFSLLGIPLSFTVALLVAAMLSATDPVAVISMFREMGVPRRLGILMEGESLLNDGVAVVAFSMVLVALGLHPYYSDLSAGFVVQFLGWEIFGALLIGGLVGFGLSWLTTQIDDHLIEITLTTVAAYGSFLLADKAHASGVIACLVAGMLTGNFGAKYGMSPTTRIAVVTFWEYAAFLANSIIFLLVGLEIHLARLAGRWLPILLLWLALLLARSILVTGTIPWLERREGKMRWGRLVAISWGGLRGGIAMVLALSLPRTWPHRGLVVDLVFGVCVLTIMVQGLSMRKLLGWFGLIMDKSGVLALEEYRGKYRSVQDALRYLDQRKANGTVDEDVFDTVHSELSKELDELETLRPDAEEIEQRIKKEREIELTRQVIQLRKDALKRALVDGHISDGVARKLIGEMDERLHELVDN